MCVSDNFIFPEACTGGPVIHSHVNKVRSEQIFFPLVPWQNDEQKSSLLSNFSLSSEHLDRQAGR